MPSRFLVFGDLRFDTATRELARIASSGSTTPLPLGSRAADILFLFLQRPGELVTKNEITDAVWPNTAIEDSNLTVQVSALRRALDAGGAGASAIATVPGRGYRFTLPVREASEAEPVPATPQHLDRSDAAGQTPGTAAASTDHASPQSSWNRFALAGMPRWTLLGAIAVPLLALVVLGLHWGGFFAAHPDSRETIDFYRGRGQSFVNAQEFDRAIADFTETIRLDPLSPRAYRDRAKARRYKGDYDGAIADAGKAIELFPVDHLGYVERGDGYLAKGDFDRAIADYDAAIRIMPRSDGSFFGRGRAYFLSGDLTKAQADFQSSIDLHPNWYPPVLWLAAVQLRGKLTGRLEDAARRFVTPPWLIPVVRMLLGEITPAQALTAANDADPITRGALVCLANFYGGELALSQNSRDEAARLFGLAAGDCLPVYPEKQGAAAELRALGNSP